MKDYQTLEDTYLANVYSKRPLIAVKGRGAKVWDSTGREYIDCLAGHGVCILGHCHPKVIEAVHKQVEELISCSNLLYNPVRAEFGERLCSIAPKGLNKVFLSNSGTEAVECAIKLARKHTGRKEVIALMRAFHGRTLGALSATWNKKYREPFLPLIPGFKHVKPTIDAVKDAITEDTAAIIFEPIMGESGVIRPPEGFVSALGELCESRGILLIADEIQTGLGRTGKMFACEHFGVTPDIMCLAKGLANGYPIGATLAKEDIMNSLTVGEHGSTYGGNPLACAAAVTTIDVLLDDRLPEKTVELGRYFLDNLIEISRRYSIVRGARGVGLMLALELRFTNREIIREACENGLLTLSSGLNIIRFLPPLVIKKEEIDTAIAILDKACESNER
ncbi:MAG: acetylornithine/succinylornithine family transaminase [Nitrososphaeria archaeon]|nr:acetylornithine/succinylornithine family transaminase [Nitrososphaeria archaeon]NIN52054.1 acetylornithine/succinylornithine family transaminase [Nitrososphaeria archaeon]NIQ32515.1 acetylornithine/succinylornithine family transaminase [Nitrososphaeria archaeon]